jgi:hypothetical protein
MMDMKVQDKRDSMNENDLKHIGKKERPIV